MSTATAETKILLHAEPGGTYKLSSLALAATPGNIFVCGVFAGHLLLRREMRWYEEKRDEQSRGPHAERGGATGA